MALRPGEVASFAALIGEYRSAMPIHGTATRLLTTLAVAALAAVLIVPPPVSASSAPVLVYATKIVERHDPACRPSRSEPFICAYVRFEYPVIKRAPTPAAAARLNDVVREYLVTGWEEPKPASIEQAADTVMRGLEYEKRDGQSFAWWVDVTVAILYQSAAILSLKFDSRSFGGGVHPNRNATFASFTAKTGAKVALDDVLVPGHRARLTRIAENAFRAQHDIKPGMTLRDAGYEFFKNDAFALNDNFWFGPRGVTFFYNNYEIAPYAMGWSEVFLSYQQITGLIRSNGLLRSMR